MRRTLTYLAAGIAALGISTGAALAGSTPAPSNAKAYIIWPYDGQVIKNGKFWLRMGAKNIGIAPAGTKKKNTGHHHVIVDGELTPFDQEIPSNNKTYRHFGGGQTEARLELPPGRHTIQLLMADHEHIPHNPPLFSEKITVVVPAQTADASSAQ